MQTDSEIALNALWKRIRDFLTDVDANGLKVELKRGQEAARIRFMQACQRYENPKAVSAGMLPFEEVKHAFNTAYLLPLPTDAEFKRLLLSLEAYYNEELQIVQWSKILDAIGHRETTSVRGIFPKIVSKSNPMAEKLALADQKAEAEKEAAKLLEEQQKRTEAKDKALEKLRRQDNSTKTKDKSGIAKPPSKEELKRIEREQAILKEEDRLQKLEQEKVEKDAVKKES